VKNAREHAEELSLITPSKTVVPVLICLDTGKLILGCPVEFEEFLNQLKNIVKSSSLNNN